MKAIDILLMGWNDNTLECLKGLLIAGFKPAAVLLPKGYDYDRLRAVCNKNKIPSFVVAKGDDVTKYRKGCNVLISASWPFRIKSWEIKKFSLGGINVHASLLPKYRGYHPLNWALINDEKMIGVTVHYLDEGFDTGDILAQGSFKVKDSDRFIGIREKAHLLGAKLLNKALRGIAAGSIKPIPQSKTNISFAPKRTPDQGDIDWSGSARQIFCFVRALSYPAPGAFTYIDGKKIIVWDATPVAKSIKSGRTGEVLSVNRGLVSVKTGDGKILKILKYEGPRIIKGQVFL